MTLVLYLSTSTSCDFINAFETMIIFALVKDIIFVTIITNITKWCKSNVTPQGWSDLGSIRLNIKPTEIAFPVLTTTFYRKLPFCKGSDKLNQTKSTWQIDEIPKNSKITGQLMWFWWFSNKGCWICSEYWNFTPIWHQMSKTLPNMNSGYK